MLWANVENEKIEATPRTEGTCPLCEGNVFSKCGEVKVWHWAHFKDQNCDHWYEPETFWHRNWKMTFGKENSEITISKDGERHRADILTNENVVIELQNSPIQKIIIREREEFYGKRMLWLINGIDFKKRFKVRDWEDISYKGWLKLSDLYEEKKSNNREKPFTLTYAQKSWTEAKRPVFIDFGEESLFWIKEGIGKPTGFGEYVSKEKFIKKYGGNTVFFGK